MTPRTKDERRAIAERCRQIEHEGGDVLAYLAGEHYITPRATWYNLQKEFLGRDKAHLTEGKPKERKMKTLKAQPKPPEVEVKPKNGRQYNRMPKEKLKEMEENAIEIWKGGKSPVSFLKENGYKDPNGTWYLIKKKYGLPIGHRGPVPQDYLMVAPPPTFPSKYRIVTMNALREMTSKRVDLTLEKLKNAKPENKGFVMMQLEAAMSDVKAVKRVTQLMKVALEEGAAQ